jgi:hypothetical protein
MPTPPARILVLAAALVLVAAGVVSVRTLQGTTAPAELFNRVLLSSDELFPETLYADFRSGAYDVRAFQFSAATFAFPDLVTYAGVRATAGSAPRAVLLWAAAFYLLLVGAAVLGARAVVPAGCRPAATALVLALAAGYLGMNGLVGFERRELGEFFLPLYHAGGVAAVFVGLVLTAGMCTRPGGWRSWRVPALFALSAAATFSDRLFAVWLPAPLFAAAVLTRLLRGPGRRPEVGPVPGLMVALLVIGLGAVAGLAGLKWLQAEGDPLKNYWTGAMLAAAGRRAGQLAAVVWKEAAGGNPVLLATLAWLGLSAATLAARAWANRRGGAEPDSPVGNGRFVFLAAFTLAATALNVAVLCVSKTAELLDTHPWEESSRYLLAPQVLGWFGWAAWAAHFAGGGYPRIVRVAAGWVPVAAAAGVLVVAAGRAAPPVRDVLDAYPADVAAIDRACAERGLKYGLADYGTAKRTTVLSRTGLVIRQVIGPDDQNHLHGFPWLSNAQWYWRNPDGSDARFEFVVTHDDTHHPWLLATDRVIRMAGPPADRVRVGGATLLVYNRPADGVVRDFGHENPGVRLLRDRYDRPPAGR